MDPGIFVRGGPGQSDKKSSDKVFFFFFFFLVLNLLYRSQMVNFKEIYHFSRFQRGSNIFQWGPNFSRRVQLLIPYRNPYNVIFQGGPDPLSPPPPSGSALEIVCKNINRQKAIQQQLLTSKFLNSIFTPST